MPLADDNLGSTMIGERVGSYLLDEEIGRGGMGAVYRAVRVDGEFEQVVAIKLIKRGMDTDAILRRFKRERQILATLDHPNIAYFLGGGSTESGSPYFVMEYISGRPLYAYCDSERLAIRERLLIFRQICWAVQAAHEIRVVHRDLKPSNIVVSAEGRPKLLDFGIAKALEADAEMTDHEPTATQLRVMTPEYASPEQISGEETGPSSDIYSLGVILYELLTGHRPYIIHRNDDAKTKQIITAEYPLEPSDSIDRGEGLIPIDGRPSSIADILNRRRTDLTELRRALKGDLDRVVLKALRKSPAERYSTAAEFADDITHYLEGKPVNAEHYQPGRITRHRHGHDKLRLAILPFNVLSSTTGDGGDEFVGIGFSDALISRLSVVKRLVVRPTTSILPFSGSDPFDAGRKLDVDYVLDGNVRISGDRIRVSVQLLDVNGGSTRWARAFDERTGDVLVLEDSLSEQVARSLLPELTSEEQVRLERRITNKPAAYEAYLRGRYFWSRFTDSDLQKAIREYKQAIAIDPEYSLPYIGLAEFYIWSAIFGEIPAREAFPEARSAVRKAIEIDGSMAEAYAVSAFIELLYGWDWPEAEYLVTKALDINPNYGFAHECYSNLLCSQGRFDEAVDEIKRAESLDPVSPRSILMSAWTLYQARRFDEAVAAARKANEMQPDFPQGLLHLGNCLTAAGEHDEAVTVLRRSSELWGGSGLPRHLLAFARASQGNQVAVSAILSKMLETSKTKYVKPYFIAMCHVAAGDFDTAFDWFNSAIEARDEWMVWFGVDPKLDAVRDDPRYADLLHKTNNPIAHRSGRKAAEDPTTGSRIRSIAVLPFQRVTAGASGIDSNDYLPIGIADAVTMRLSNVRKFLVRPTSSVLPFAAAELDSFSAGRQLAVEFVVDGIIRHVGGKIVVTAQLLDVNERSVRWSASFTESLADVLELEDTISEQVTRSLIPQLTGEDLDQLAKQGTRSSAAYDAYLQGRYFWNQFRPDTFPKSIQAFSRAVKIDPGFAQAHAGIADFYAWASIYGLLSPGESLQKMHDSAAKALELDSDLSEAHAAMGLYYSNMQQWDRAEEFYRRSIGLNAHYPLAHEWLSSVLVARKQFDEGLRELAEAERLDPLSLRPKVLSAWTYYQAREFDLAREKGEELLKLSPTFMQSHLQLANVLCEIGDVESALHHARRAAEIEPGSPLTLHPFCFALAAAGDINELITMLEMWKQRASENYVPPFFLGMASLAAGDKDAAFEYLDAARAEFSAWTIWYCTEPKLDSIRDDPRYFALIEKMNGPSPLENRSDAE